MRKSMPLLVVAALSVLLSACFTSEEPMFPASSAVATFGDGGRYVVFEHVGKGAFKRQGPLTVKQTVRRHIRIRPREDGAADFIP